MERELLMRKQVSSRLAVVLAVLMLAVIPLAGCGSTSAGSSKKSSKKSSKSSLKDGQYTAAFTTDSKMFHVNESKDGKCTLTVKDGKMTAHLTLQSKNIVNLYRGKAKDAKKKGAKLIQPTTDTVTYDDGTTEEVYGFDVPVPTINKKFDLALIGTHGKWYDHKVKVSDPEPVENADSESQNQN